MMSVTEEEIKTLITEGTEAGTIEEAEQEIIETGISSWRPEHYFADDTPQ